jgi:hypothetical protein
MKKISLSYLFKKMITLFAIAYLGLCLFMYLAQDTLLFHPQPLAARTQQWLADTYPNADLSIMTPDGMQLQGWLLQPAQTAEKMPLIIYFGGNAEEVSSMAFDFEQMQGWSLLLMNYRGYGLSEGKPSEKNLFKDAVTIFDAIIQREDIDKQAIVVMGRSLGTGVAVHLAAHRPVRGVVLISPYGSISQVAQEIYPYLPVSLLNQHPFDALSLAPAITAPLFALVAEKDTLVKPSHSYQLADNWGGQHTVKLLKGVDHDTILTHSAFWPSVVRFLTQIKH